VFSYIQHIPEVVFLSFCFCRGTLEGKRQKPEYDKLLSNPMLKFSGLYQDGFADLMVVCQVFSDGRPLALPVSTSYKAFTTRWK
jgi:phosphatidylinositol 3-kinase